MADSDLKYGHGSALWKYWTRGEGFAKWSGAVHKWTTLRDLLLAAGVPSISADGLATNIIMAVMPGYKATGRSDVTYTSTNAMVTATQRADAKKPYGNVTYADPRNGKYPIDTIAHARAALAYISMPKNASQYPMNGVTLSDVKARIVAACKKFGIEVSDDSSGKSASRTEYMRLYPLEDMHIIRSADGGDGRTVEAFAAVFDDPAEIVDHEGHYVEVIERSAFNKVLADATRARGGLPGSVKVLYNHGMTIQGTPSERFSMPIGVPVDIRAEARGLLTRTRYNDTPLAEEILENIRAGSITSQSFTGRIVRSDPQLRRGDRHRPDSAGNLRTVRRSELGLREYGPVLWPAYSGAEILGVRMSTPGALGEDDPEPDTDEEALPLDEGAAADEPPPLEESHSQRYHQHALYVLRSAKLREECGLVW